MIGRQIRAGLVVALTIVAMLAATMAPASAESNDAEFDAPFALGATELSVQAPYGGPEGLWGSDVGRAIGMEKAWQKGFTGAGIDVAVIDTGVNAVAGLSAPGKVIDGPDFSFDSGSDTLRHRDLFGHGSAMAGLVAGEPNVGVERLHKSEGRASGAAPGARIVNVKVGDGVGAVDPSQVIAGIDWVVQNRRANGMNIRVLLLAYDTDSEQPYTVDPLSYAVENAWRHGIVVVVSSGNEGGTSSLGNPATNPYVLAVGAAAPKGDGWTIPPWGSMGNGTRNADVVVPGESILAPAVRGSFLAQAYPSAVFSTPDGVMIRGSGTSQAAAFAAGAVAVLLEARPELTPDEVKMALTRTARPLSEFTGFAVDRKLQGSGLVDLAGAVSARVAGAAQWHAPATGSGSLELSRGSYHVGSSDDQLTGEFTAFGDEWLPKYWIDATSSGHAFTDQKWDGTTWAAGSWLASVWKGATWNGSTWSGGHWDGDAWSGATWSGATWSGATWSGATWSGATWSGATWSGATWSGSTWSGSTWSGTTWSGSTWSGTTWSGSTWSGSTWS